MSIRLCKVNKLSLKRRLAFTLAETLITLSIIGVIATLTIPNLINKHNNTANVIKLKKAYSLLQNALKMAPLNESCSAGDYECAGLFVDTLENAKILSKQFKVQKFCETAEEEGCTYARSFITEDGMTYYMSHTNLIIVDINNDQKPNKYARDIFAFRLATEPKDRISAGTVMPYGSETDAIYFGLPDNSYFMNYMCTPNNLKTNNVNALFCTGKVLEEEKIEY